MTIAEAEELRDSLDALLGTDSHHEHVSSEDLGKEITLTVYEKHRLTSYDERSRRLIEDDL